MKKKDQQFEPGQMVEAIQPCSMDVDGIAYVFNPGTRISSDHPAVKASPQLFQALDQPHADAPRT